MTALDHHQLVAALRAVSGVVDAHVQPDSEGGLGTLRLDLELGADEAAVAARVGQLLRDEFALGVDADRVEIVEDAVLHRPAAATVTGATTAAVAAATSRAGSVTEVDEAAIEVDEDDTAEDAFVPGPRMAPRPAIARMHLVSSGLDVTATVTLSSGVRTAVGEARGTASQSGVHRAVATATLHAVEELVDGQVRFELDHLEVAAMGNERTVLVSLTLLTAKGTERLTGAAGVREDVRQAVIRATLDALNRRLQMLLTSI